MKKSLFSVAIILIILLPACAPNDPDLQPTKTPRITPLSTIAPTKFSLTTTPTSKPVDEKFERDAAITSISNQVQARITAQANSVAAVEGLIVRAGGDVQTFDDSRVSLNLRPEETIVRVGPNTIFTVQELSETEQPSARIHLDIGQIWILLTGGSLEVETPSGVAAVRGSLLGVFYDPVLNYMEASCLEGHCILENEFGKVELTTGQISFISGNFEPSEVDFMDGTKLQEWVNENPDVWQFFDPEEIPEWLPPPDLGLLKEQDGYFEWVFDEEENPFLDKFLENYDPETPPLNGEGVSVEPPNLPDKLPDLPDEPPNLPGGDFLP